MITFDKVKTAYAAKGYKFYAEKAYQVNLFGIRNNALTVDEFNDVIGIAYLDEYLTPQCLPVRGTTKPGLYWLGKEHIGNSNGTAILIPGFYEKCWMLGKHKDEYEALVQSKAGVFKVWRDKDQDGSFDYSGTVYTDVAGLNRHTTSFNTNQQKVSAYSAGCQVIRDDKEHLIHLNICKRSVEYYPANLFSYALFLEEDFTGLSF